MSMPSPRETPGARARQTVCVSFSLFLASSLSFPLALSLSCSLTLLLSHSLALSHAPTRALSPSLSSFRFFSLSLSLPVLAVGSSCAENGVRVCVSLSLLLLFPFSLSRCFSLSLFLTFLLSQCLSLSRSVYLCDAHVPVWCTRETRS